MCEHIVAREGRQGVSAATAPCRTAPLNPRAATPAHSSAQAQQQQPAAPSSEGGTNWAGVAAAGLVVAGLSAAVYFAPEDALKGAAPPLPKVRGTGLCDCYRPACTWLACWCC